MRRGWFKIGGVQDGDRTLELQLVGLEPALKAAAGKSVLDLGCAEGLISREFARRGAVPVLGVEIVAEHLEAARELCAGLPIEFQVADIGKMKLPEDAGGWDIVLMLAVLHKTREPERVLKMFAAATRELLVIRLPGGAKDGRYSLPERRGNSLVDVARVMAAAGFVLERTERGPETRERGREPVLYFRRVGNVIGMRVEGKAA